MYLDKTKFVVCTDGAVEMDNLIEAMDEAESYLEKHPKSIFYVCEVVAIVKYIEDWKTKKPKLPDDEINYLKKNKNYEQKRSGHIVKGWGGDSARCIMTDFPNPFKSHDPTLIPNRFLITPIGGTDFINKQGRKKMKLEQKMYPVCTSESTFQKSITEVQDKATELLKEFPDIPQPKPKLEPGEMVLPEKSFMDLMSNLTGDPKKNIDDAIKSAVHTINIELEKIGKCIEPNVKVGDADC